MVEWNPQGAFGHRLVLFPVGHLVDHHPLGGQGTLGVYFGVLISMRQRSGHLKRFDNLGKPAGPISNWRFL